MLRGRARRPWSLRTRLVVSAVSLIAVVGAAIGTITTLALRDHLVGELDDRVRAAVRMSERVPGTKPGPDGARTDAAGAGPEGFGIPPGSPLGTVLLRLDAQGGVSAGVRTAAAAENHRLPLTPAQTHALARTGLSGTPRDLDLPGLGGYRVASAESRTGPTGGRVVIGFPLSDVDSTVTTLVAVEVCVTLAGILAASLVGSALVGVALRPLRRVAATAARVSELPLHRGEPDLRERVPAGLADPRTEVGQVGAALNRMLGHVSEALVARQESETRVRRFVADASHELRTPLASIRGYAELTRRGREETGPDTRHALNRIESEAGRMTGLVEDLLLLARLDAGRPLEHAAFDPVPLVVDSLGDARVAGPDHHWRLDLPDPDDPLATAAPDAPVEVRGDAARIQQVLVNLLANARVHTPPGTTVTARVSRETAWTRIEVEDDGPGIPPETLPHVFERFARGDASRSRVAGSTGLGLAIVHAVVAAHHGTVTVDSRPGHTLFRVRLPHAAPHSQPAHRPATRP
ncbi:sensor histidine kinase [Streptomyces sp. BI20]|uniref:sensor histidine kinase n=1 Tax=Streptomyces sp. BI20 TaxID=3403460 RepID=UPI003C791A96